MTPSLLLLITQLIALGTQAASQIIALKQQLGEASSATEQANLAASEAELAKVVANAQTALGTASTTTHA
jgi:hypothetical protein